MEVGEMTGQPNLLKTLIIVGVQSLFYVVYENYTFPDSHNL